MPTPRKALIAVEDTPYYHVVSRCVRRAFLCGFDVTTGTDYEHRRAEIEERLLFLGTVFAIDICAYAIMSNHHHEVLHIDQNSAANWSDEEVVRRWHQIYNGTLFSQRFAAAQTLTAAEKLRLDESIAEWRKRLASISWFMRRLNEPTARQANKEDECTGKFFEARFKSQALLDEQALISCMAYNDLNPIRANMADTPESSDHTSIKRRIEAAQKNTVPSQLMRFQGNAKKPESNSIPFALKDYIELVEWTGRVIHPNKRGFIQNDKPELLKRLKVSPEEWIELAEKFEDHFSTWVGNAQSLEQLSARRNLHHTAGSQRCRQAFNVA